MIYSAVSGWQWDAAHLEVRGGSSHSCSSAGQMLWPQICLPLLTYFLMCCAQHMTEEVGSSCSSWGLFSCYGAMSCYLCQANRACSGICLTPCWRPGIGRCA